MHCTVLALKMQHSAKQGHKTSGSVIVAEKPTPAGIFAASYASAEPPTTDWYLWVARTWLHRMHAAGHECVGPIALQATPIAKPAFMPSGFSTVRPPVHAPASRTIRQVARPSSGWRAIYRQASRTLL